MTYRATQHDGCQLLVTPKYTDYLHYSSRYTGSNIHTTIDELMPPCVTPKAGALFNK